MGPIRHTFARGAAAGMLMLLIFLASGFIRQEEEVYLKINKGIDLLGRIYKEVTLNYVDDVDPSEMMEAGIRGLLASLDPYTVFIDESGKSDVEMLTTGKYGGIGITVGMRDGILTVTGVMEGYAAEREGLRIGDHILAIDGHEVARKRPEDARIYMRGDPGTRVTLMIERPGRNGSFAVTLQREEIAVRNVTYAALVDDRFGYIRLDRFGRSAGEDLRDAIKKLRAEGEMKGVILDLRDNPGGLLDAATSVVEKFVPRGSLVVSTKGRRENSTRQYFTEAEPMAPDLPLVLLVNGGSASASEIVAGAVQDLDRGVLLGSRTFGKGLVQTVTALSYNTSLKITTARYYTPSGRCIQEIDYARRDSLRHAAEGDTVRPAYHTLLFKRHVSDAGGITPDSIILPPAQSNYVRELGRRGIVFDFATSLANAGGAARATVTDDVLADLKRETERDTARIEEELQKQTNDLIASAEKEKVSAEVLQTLARARRLIQQERGDLFARNRDAIREMLEVELAGRYEGNTGRIRTSLRYDPLMQTALTVLKTPSLYARLLHKPH